MVQLRAARWKVPNNLISLQYHEAWVCIHQHSNCLARTASILRMDLIICMDKRGVKDLDGGGREKGVRWKGVANSNKRLMIMADKLHMGMDQCILFFTLFHFISPPELSLYLQVPQPCDDPLNLLLVITRYYLSLLTVLLRTRTY